MFTRSKGAAVLTIGDIETVSKREHIDILLARVSDGDLRLKVRP